MTEKSFVPKYETVVEFIKNQIHSGVYRVGELIPGERIIAETLSVSRPSIKRAIKELESAGIIECLPSQGSVVRKVPESKLIVGYLIDDLQDPFHMELIRELDFLLHEINGGLIVAQGREDTRLLSMGINRLVKHHTLFNESVSEKVMTVYIGNLPAKVNMVVSDIKSGMEMIYNHLKSLGHERIAYASPMQKKYDIQYPYLFEALKKDKNKLVAHFPIGPHEEQQCESILKKIKNLKNRPTALVCYNDWLAISFIEAAKAMRLDIPGELSLTGYDDLYMSSVLQVALTTIRFSRSETARKIIDILLKPSGTNEPRIETVETNLIVRESTARIK
ncbi:MAG: GntR family transcriptional regulator [Spirochaetales bacterium]|nr:MAG: GntR family transcriptional regulator [Spirochaetales bacterium]